MQAPGCFGARMTGGGFGGCTVSLVRRDTAEKLIQWMTLAYRKQLRFLESKAKHTSVKPWTSHEAEWFCFDLSRPCVKKPQVTDDKISHLQVRHRNRFLESSYEQAGFSSFRAPSCSYWH